MQHIRARRRPRGKAAPHRGPLSRTFHDRAVHFSVMAVSLKMGLAEMFAVWACNALACVVAARVQHVSTHSLACVATGRVARVALEHDARETSAHRCVATHCNTLQLESGVGGVFRRLSSWVAHVQQRRCRAGRLYYQRRCLEPCSRVVCAWKLFAW